MKKSWRMISLLIVLAMVLAACGGGAKPAPAGETKTGGEPTSSESTGETAGAASEKILIVTSPSGVDDGNFNEDNYNGIQAFIKANPSATVNSVQEQNSEPQASVQAVADVYADYDVIVTPGFQFAGISELAQQNPEKKFILVDTNPAPIDGTEVFENVYAMTFKEEESGFFAGVAAALETKTGKVAVVNGIAFPSNVNYQYGFESGVNYAVKHLGAKAEAIEIASYAGEDVNKTNVGGNYIGTFNDPANGKVVGNALISQGVDVLFVAAGGSGAGVFTAAKEGKDIKVIGCDVDEWENGAFDGGNVILTSVIKNMSMNVEKQLKAIAGGTFKGGNELLGVDSDSTGYIEAEGRQQMKPETIKTLGEVKATMKGGTIVPAANFNGHTPEAFPGL